MEEEKQEEVELDPYEKRKERAKIGKDLRTTYDDCIELEKKGELREDLYQGFTSPAVPGIIFDSFKTKLGQEGVIQETLANQTREGFSAEETKEYEKLEGLEDKNNYLFDRMSPSARKALAIEHADSDDIRILMSADKGSDKLREARAIRVGAKAEKEILDERILQKNKEARREKERASMSPGEQIKVQDKIDSRVKEA